jgi:hypothetical protein
MPELSTVSAIPWIMTCPFIKRCLPEVMITPIAWKNWDNTIKPVSGPHGALASLRTGITALHSGPVGIKTDDPAEIYDMLPA